MQAVGSFDILVNSYQTTWRHIPKDSSLRAYVVKSFVRSSSLRTLYSHPTHNEYFLRNSNAICFHRKYDELPEERHWRRHVFRARMRKLQRQKALRGRNQPYTAACDMEFCCYADCVRPLKYEANVTEEFIEIHIQALLAEHLTCILQVRNLFFWITTPPRQWEWVPDVSTNYSVLTNEMLDVLALLAWCWNFLHFEKCVKIPWKFCFWCWKRMEKISLTERVKNEVLHIAKEQTNILYRIKHGKDKEWHHAL